MRIIAQRFTRSASTRRAVCADVFCSYSAHACAHLARAAHRTVAAHTSPFALPLTAAARTCCTGTRAGALRVSLHAYTPWRGGGKRTRGGYSNQIIAAAAAISVATNKRTAYRYVMVTTSASASTGRRRRRRVGGRISGVAASPRGVCSRFYTISARVTSRITHTQRISHAHAVRIVARMRAPAHARAYTPHCTHGTALRTLCHARYACYACTGTLLCTRTRASLCTRHIAHTSPRTALCVYLPSIRAQASTHATSHATPPAHAQVIYARRAHYSTLRLCRVRTSSSYQTSARGIVRARASLAYARACAARMAYTQARPPATHLCYHASRSRALRAISCRVRGVVVISGGIDIIIRTPALCRTYYTGYLYTRTRTTPQTHQAWRRAWLMRIGTRRNITRASLAPPRANITRYAPHYVRLHLARASARTPFNASHTRVARAPPRCARRCDAPAA